MTQMSKRDIAHLFVGQDMSVARFKELEAENAKLKAQVKALVNALKQTRKPENPVQEAEATRH